MLNTSIEMLENRAKKVQKSLENILKTEVLNTNTLVGGGTTPNKKIPSIALTLEYKNYKPNELEKLLRKNNLIARIENEKILLDFRTIQENEIEKIANILKKIFESAK